jgi:hypothetical protein
MLLPDRCATHRSFSSFSLILPQFGENFESHGPQLSFAELLILALASFNWGSSPIVISELGGVAGMGPLCRTTPARDHHNSIKIRFLACQETYWSRALVLQRSSKKAAISDLVKLPAPEELALLIRERRSIFPKDFCYDPVDRCCIQTPVLSPVVVLCEGGGSHGFL